MSKTNKDRLQEIAEALQDLNDRIVYVGGVMAGLYANDPVATEPRTTIDVDCIVNTTSYKEHADFEELLRARHFQNDQSPGAPLCRWVFNGEIVDVMSMNENVLSFGNPWYRPGFSKREPYELPSGKTIYKLPATYYIATKIDALLSRGGGDWRRAKDFEDIVYVLNYCTDFVDKFKAEDREVQAYVSEQFAQMLRRPNISEEIECAIASDEIERTDMILDILRTIADSSSNYENTVCQ